MQAQTDLDFSARAQRDHGMTVALLNADSHVEGWSDYAMILLQHFIKENPGREFITEEVREFAKAHGLGDPPSNKAWGWIMLGAARNGLIEKCGYRETINPVSHQRPATLWRRKI